MKKKKYKIAFTGVFDLANYGDHLFPLIFRKNMEKEGEIFEIYLFSPFEGVQAFDETIRVYSLFDLEKMHEEVMFDAIIVGGGETIHLHSFEHKYKNQYIEYPIYNCWVIPAIVAQKYNVLLAWNNPGVPFHFSGMYKRMVKNLMKTVDYISVRNQFSVEALMEVGVDRDEINLCPDTAFLLPEIYEIKELKITSEKLLNGIAKKYIVFQCNKLIDEESLNKVVEILLKLKNEGYEIVLLPLAYTNEDDVFENEINEKNGNQFYGFNRKLSLEEIISVLACCEMYIGVSFHGAITAYSFGKKVVGFDFFFNKKTKDLFDIMGIPELYVTDALKLEETIEKAFDMEKDVSEYKSRIEKDLKKHFNNLKQIMVAEKKEQCIEEYRIISDIISDISKECQKNEGERNQLKLKDDTIKSLKEYMYIMQLEIEKKEKECAELTEERNYIRAILGEKKYNRILERARRRTKI